MAKEDSKAFDLVADAVERMCQLMTGRTPTPEEVEEAKRIVAEIMVNEAAMLGEVNDWGPDLPSLGVPTKERPGLEKLNGALSNLRSIAGDFKAALQLFDFAEFHDRQLVAERQRRPEDPQFLNEEQFQESHAKSALFRSWKAIAARDGAMTVFHFRKALTAANQLIRLVPSLKPYVLQDRRKAAGTIFAAAFPDFEPVRHSVAHSAEFQAAESQASVHAVPGEALPKPLFDMPGGSAFISNMLIGRRLTATVYRRVVSYELSEASLEALNRSRFELYNALLPASGFTRRQGVIASRSQGP